MKYLLDKISKQTLFFISLIGIVVVSLIMVTTFAYQTLQVEYTSDSKKNLTVNAGVLDVSFVVTNRINDNNIPFLDDYKTANYSEFTIDNTKSSEDASYKIKLVDLEYSDALKTSDFKYTIVKVNDDGLEIISEGDFSTLSTTEIELSKYKTIKKASTEKLRLYLWIKNSNENQNNLKNSSFKGIIQIESMFDTETPTLKNAILRNAKNATGERTIYQETPTTIPGQAISTETERTLSKTTDDYGDSYYFRGNVIDNYVNFAGMCWRIVRIQGDGSVKLILEDQDSNCDTSDGNWNIPITTGGSSKTGNFGYTEYNTNTLTASDGTLNSSPRYLMNYLNGRTENDKSMATAFKNFQNGVLANYLSYLKVGDWCLNDKAYATKSDNSISLTSQEILDKQVKGEILYYDSYVRLNGKTTKEPTLKCIGTNMNKFADDTDMYVGTLTADDIVYAGGRVYSNNPNYYLINNYQKSNSLLFWSLSPNLFSGNNYLDYVFLVNREGLINDLDVHSGNRYSFRPAVTLLSNIQISEGNGTSSNPYTLKLS